MIPNGCVEQCPGCRYRQLSPEESDARKQAWAEQCLVGLGPIAPIASPSKRWGYRRKVLLHAEYGENGWRLGLLKRRGWDSELIEIPNCPIHAPELNVTFHVLKNLLNQQPNLPLAFVLASGPLLTLVLKCKENKVHKEWARGTEKLLKEQGVEGLQLNWNPSAGRRPVSSRHQEIIFGPKLAHDGEGFYGALSFRQQIAELEKLAARESERFLAGLGQRRIVDLYSGSGTTLRLWEKLGWDCVGVELQGDAVEAAAKNAPLSLLLKGKVEQRIPQLDEWLGKSEEGFVLYTNPPRTGQGPAVNEWILSARPAAIAYLSCNQKSLAADLHALAPMYRVQRVLPLDFFPQTDHVESLTLLRLQ